MEKYLRWLKEQLKECKTSYTDRYNDNEYYLNLEGQIQAYEDAIEELEDGLKYCLCKQEKIDEGN